MGASTATALNSGTGNYSFDTQTPSGILRYSYAPNATLYSVNSTAVVTNNAWHFAAVTVADGNPTIMTLYVDGLFQNSTTFASGATQRSLYMHLGSIGFGQPVQGAVSNAALWNTALNASAIGALYDAATQADYANLVTTSGATNYWPLTDDGYTSFSGPYTPIAPRSPCDFAGIILFDSNGCIFPVTTSGCGSIDTMTAFANVVTPLPQVALGATEALKFQIRRVEANSWADGLQLSMPIVIKQSQFDQTFTWLQNRVLITP